MGAFHKAIDLQIAANSSFYSVTSVSTGKPFIPAACSETLRFDGPSPDGVLSLALHNVLEQQHAKHTDSELGREQDTHTFAPSTLQHAITGGKPRLWTGCRTFQPGS